VKSERGSTPLGCGGATDDRHMKYTDIVIVDGDDANRATLCRALTGIGFSHACVRSGVEALKQLTTNPFKVALLDASLSDTDGVATLRRRMGEMQPPGIIVVVGVNTPDRALGALKTHKYDVVSTPIEADLLQQVIQRALTADFAMPPVEVLCADRTWVNSWCRARAKPRNASSVSSINSKVTSTWTHANPSDWRCGNCC
jgi:CheY-like chemotaxis protein